VSGGVVPAAASLSPLYQYVFSPLSGKTPILRDSTFDRETGAATSARRLYFTSDANTNVTGLVDASGQVVERYYYSAYGQVTFCDASWTPLTTGGTNGTTPGSSSAVGNNTLYASMVLDPRTGLFYDEHRWYDAWTSTFVSQDPIGVAGGINLYEYVGGSPTNATDPTGLWRFVPGMGTLSGSLGPSDEGAYGKASSCFQLTFDPDRKVFAANKNDTCCAEIKFVQIFYMDVSSYTGTTLPNRKWTIDGGSPPYYPDGDFYNPSNPDSIGSCMHDSPYFSSLWRYARPSTISMDFETAALSSKSKSPGSKKGVGDVFACVRWGHSFQIDGTAFNAHVTGWKRHVESDVWTDSVFVVGGPRGINPNNPRHQFKGIANAPSDHMKAFLNQYFPSGK
jgi:RHS repeat-associated protein